MKVKEFVNNVMIVFVVFNNFHMMYGTVAIFNAHVETIL